MDISNWVNLHNVVNSIIYSLIGMFLLGFGFFIYEQLTPKGLWNEIINEKNIALAIVVGAALLGISNIIAYAITG